MRKKTSVIWKISKEELLSVVSSSTSFGQILKYFNLTNKGGNVKTLKSRLDCDNIGYDHIRLGKDSNLGRKFLNSKKINLDKILTEHSSYSRGGLKRRLISENILENKCLICGLENKWQEKPLTLQLDHINGISDDNRLENLRLLCPNCHSQTETFAGRSLRKKYYCSCGEEICKYSNNCNICIGLHKRKFNPTRQELEDLVQLHPMTTIGKMFGVSDNAVRKRCIKLGIEI
jgi:5-methylcytosine-specific restriction endonuclease McrA